MNYTGPFSQKPKNQMVSRNLIIIKNIKLDNNSLDKPQLFIKPIWKTKILARD